MPLNLLDSLPRLCLFSVPFLASWSALASSAPKPVVAVFDLENGAKLKSADVLALTGYLSTRLAEGGRYRVVPKSEVQSALRAKKAESYQTCYDESCQIEIGRELAAQKTLSSKVSQLGSTCIVTVQLYDLAQGASEAAGTSRGGCKVEEILNLLDEALAPLVRAAAAPEVAKVAPVERAPESASASSSPTELPPELADLPMPQVPSDLEVLDQQVRVLPFMLRPRARSLLVTEIQGLERLLESMPKQSPDHAQVLRRVAFAYGELEFSTRQELVGDPRKVRGIEMAARTRHIELLKSLVEVDPSAKSADIALCALGLAHERAADPASSRKVLFSLIQKHPSSTLVPLAYLTFADLFWREGQQPLAQQAFAEAAKRSTELAAYAHYRAAFVSVLSNDRVAALSGLHQARQLAQKLPDNVPWKAALVAGIDRTLTR